MHPNSLRKNPESLERSERPPLALCLLSLCLASSLHCTQCQPPCPSSNTSRGPTQASGICCSQCLENAPTYPLQSPARIPRTLSLPSLFKWWGIFWLRYKKFQQCLLFKPFIFPLIGLLFSPSNIIYTSCIFMFIDHYVTKEKAPHWQRFLTMFFLLYLQCLESST